MSRLFKVFIIWMGKEKEPTELYCPVCGYYCLGEGGVWCIDKPYLCRDRINING